MDSLSLKHKVTKRQCDNSQLAMVTIPKQTKSTGGRSVLTIGDHSSKEEGRDEGHDHNDHFHYH